MARTEEGIMIYCIFGASGFIGQRLIPNLDLKNPFSLRVAEHQSPVPDSWGATVLRGDIGSPDFLKEFLSPGAIVINLAYPASSDTESAVRSAKLLGKACRDAGIRRLVHLSTAVVAGDIAASCVDENSACEPKDAYGRAKLAIEIILQSAAQGSFELAIVRPTAVFGPGGRNLQSLVLRVANDSLPHRALRAFVMGQRRMHAVDVEAVARAIAFLAQAELATPQQTFIIADDETPRNNYWDIESDLARALGVSPLPSWLPCLPQQVFRVLLTLARRPDTDPDRIYSSAKLRQLGFRMPRDFGDALKEYAKWFSAHRHDFA
ncbi:MAG: hypothetical protein A3H35_15940 [Betaproteobacteria bacterium RIFCSPLOWO2_02_FULL_62_17]|nr:MAG: hypothetical protein A3H35_15940 [Betaproteobacteria bacterium RIFCSPLOWO2_02_FULL_62_17]